MSDVWDDVSCNVLHIQLVNLNAKNMHIIDKTKAIINAMIAIVVAMKLKKPDFGSSGPRKSIKKPNMAKTHPTTKRSKNKYNKFKKKPPKREPIIDVAPSRRNSICFSLFDSLAAKQSISLAFSSIKL